MEKYFSIINVYSCIKCLTGSSDIVALQARGTRESDEIRCRYNASKSSAKLIVELFINGKKKDACVKREVAQ